MNTLTDAPKLPAVPSLPEDAPFTLEQRAWLNGYLAAFYSVREYVAARSAGDAHPALTALAGRNEAPVAKLTLTIAFGSQTGTSESLAKKVRKKLEAAGAFTVKLRDLATYGAADLAGESCLLLITSTYGDGEPPDNAKAFHALLHAADAPRLEQLSYAVLALGDTNYEMFCQTGKDFDARLQALGARRLLERVDCDVDYDEPVAGWLSGVEKALAGLGGVPTPSPVVETAPVEVLAPAFSKSNPFPSRMLMNNMLNGPESIKDTRHIALNLGESGLTYEPGDALGVLPVNCPQYVDSLLKALNADGEEPVTVPGGEEMSLRRALSQVYEIRRLTNAFMHAYADLARTAELSNMLKAEHKPHLDAWMAQREILDVLIVFPGVIRRPAEFTGMLKKLQPRLYSIASSQRAHPGEVHLTVSVVKYNALQRERKGVCSTFLAERCGEEVAPRIFVHHNPKFRLPADLSAPVIMIGPGSGIAPFRGFLQERRATGATGPNWLFFGDQHEACDFLYGDDLRQWHAEGLLTRLDTAFSRDQAQKIYVQDRLRENAADVYAWLEKGAYLYVCGDASRMAKDVDKALVDVAAIAGGHSEEGAAAYVQALRSAGRYLRDVY
jgi:sulfite reductase (NADPH) flavoprotein alpha-component